MMSEKKGDWISWIDLIKFRTFFLHSYVMKTMANKWELHHQLCVDKLGSICTLLTAH